MSQKTLTVITNPKAISDKNKYNFKSFDYYQRGKELLALLHDLGAVCFDSNNRLVLSSFFRNNKKPGNISRLLGYLAEGIVVRACNSDTYVNRKWANYARRLRQENNVVKRLLISIFYEPFLANPDEYKAIGTGFASTKGEHGHIYNPVSDRDICWLNLANGRQLLSVRSIKKLKEFAAGVQIKVSCAKTGAYVTNYLKNKPCYKLYPVVYFDLGGDFSTVQNNLYRLDSETVSSNSIFSNYVDCGCSSRREILDMMLIRGKDIAPDLHEELEYYKFLLSEILLGKYSLDDLNSSDVLLSLITDYVSHHVEQATPVLTVST